MAPSEPSTPAGRSLFQSAGRTEERVIKTYNDALRQAERGTIDTNRFLQVLERDVLPPWRAQRQRLTQAQGLPAQEQRLVQQFGRSFQMQEEGWELLGRAVRQNDPQLAEQAKRKSQEAEQLAQQVGAEASRYFSNSSTDSGPSGWLIIVGIVSAVLCLFLVKGFFKGQRVDPSLRVEITESEQPVLFAFIRRLCRETQAPFPHRVYLTPDVNAAVFYHESFLSLFLPTPKNLIIGLGLVNRLNLSEFKAVLAHEFGHFSQNSMKLGSYVYMSNRVIGDLVFGRDWLDDMVATLRGIDLRIAIFAWGFTGLLWVLRKGLQGLFQVINFTNSALSRQMEYNADLVAVSVTGSDALVHGLARLDFATDTLGQAWSDLTAAADHQLYSRDLFYHQTRAADYLRALRNDPRLGEPPPLPRDPEQAVQVFTPEDTSVPRMWATHPSNHDREVNAKRHYIRSPLDERSPWLLFQDGAAVREEVTRRVYEMTRKVQPEKLDPPEVVQAFIDDEHAETTYHPRYHGLYDHRYLTPGDLEELIRAAPVEFAGADHLSEAHTRLYGDELKSRMEAHRGRQQEYGLLARLAQGTVELTGKDFAFRGNRHRAGEAQPLLEQIQKELDQDFEWMGSLDRQVLLVHHEMARRVGDDLRQELEQRYRFHLALEELHSHLSAHNQQVQATLGQLAGKRELSMEEFHGAVGVLRQAHDTLAARLEAADSLRLPALKNLSAGESLGAFLMTRPLIRPLSGNESSLDGTWIGQFLEQLGEVIDKSQRIHFKSLGGILALQERIAERWAAPRTAPSPSPVAVPQEEIK